MKAYALDLRERVVKFVQVGGSKVEAGRRFSLGRSTVYRYLAAVKTSPPPPTPSFLLPICPNFIVDCYSWRQIHTQTRR